MSKFWKRLSLAGAVFLALVAFFVVACGAATTTASCAFVVGNGSNGNDANLHRIVYPGQNATPSNTEAVTYVPCNSRNYIINDGQIKNANGQTVGDRATLITATTKTGVGITIAARALWTLNQSKPAMTDFYTVCFKYQCASTQDVGGGVNFSTPGWNGMLAENFGPAMDGAGRKAAIGVEDSIWQKHDPAQYQTLGDGMSAVFADVMRANLGFPEDLFCGSGNSAWSDKNSPGQGTFTCSPVRIVVDDVQVSRQVDQTSQGAEAINAQRSKNALTLYGPGAGNWLGLMDAIDKCKAAGATCIINIGGTGGGVSVPVPLGSNTDPTPTPTPPKR